MILIPVYMNYAEALNEINGPTEEAYSALNMVRRRAQVSELAGLSQSDFGEAIYEEREHEFFIKCEDWFDLVRTGRMIPENQKLGITVDSKYKLFPIPQREIDLSNGAMIQNPGY